MGFSSPTPFEIRRNDESRQDETGSESEDTGSPREAIQDNVQARSTGAETAWERWNIDPQKRNLSCQSHGSCFYSEVVKGWKAIHLWCTWLIISVEGNTLKSSTMFCDHRQELGGAPGTRLSFLPATSPRRIHAPQDAFWGREFSPNGVKHVRNGGSNNWYKTSPKTSKWRIKNRLKKGWPTLPQPELRSRTLGKEVNDIYCGFCGE